MTMNLPSALRHSKTHRAKTAQASVRRSRRLTGIAEVDLAILRGEGRPGSVILVRRLPTGAPD